MPSQDEVKDGGRPGGAGPVVRAVLTAALFGSVLAGIDGAVALAMDGNFGLGHVAAYLAAAAVGVPSVIVVYRVFRAALRWEREAASPEPPEGAAPAG